MTSEQGPSLDVADTETETGDVHIPSSYQACPAEISKFKRIARKCVAYWRPILLTALVIAAMGLAAGLLFFQYRTDRQVDDAVAREVVRSASGGAVASLSYSADSLDRDFAQAKTHLTGDFLDYYTKFTAQIVAPMVQQNHITQKASVVQAAVSQLDPASAVVLVFIDQTVTSKDKPQPLTTPGTVRVTLTKVNGSWLISKLNPL
jgi:Mce-associated membrane protein